MLIFIISLDSISLSCLVFVTCYRRTSIFVFSLSQQADIFNDQLMIALEPEAASVLCRYTSDAAGQEIFTCGSKYMVVDLGGK